MFDLCVSGGLAEEVDEKVLHAAFIPFGDIIDIQIPLDYETGEECVNTSGSAVFTIESELNVSFFLFLQRSTGALLSLSLSWQRLVVYTLAYIRHTTTFNNSSHFGVF